VSFASCIADTRIEPGTVGLYFIAQAGFCIKTPDGAIVLVDPYFSDYCGREFGMKRMTPSILRPKDLTPDIVIMTHNHADHLDPDALPILVENEATFFVGAQDCLEPYLATGLTTERFAVLAEGEGLHRRGVAIQATYADHGDLAPQAIGVLLSVEGVTLYFTGDTALTSEKILPTIDRPVDIMVAPINGAYGNLDGREACELAKLVKPRVLIASHFWMFVEHGAGPGPFVEAAAGLPEGIEGVVMAPGEEMLYSADEGVVRRRVLDPLTDMLVEM
jgi:L-ascorbate 6-phosphate lactonase